MPGSVSSNSSRTSSVGRLRTSGSHVGSHHESSLHSHSRRSVSPTDHIRERYATSDRLQDRLFELNKFIYQGIDKFLDREAVRDLITAYDVDDIITTEGGLENDFFNHNLDSVEYYPEEQMLTIVQEQGKTIFVQQNVVANFNSRKGAFKTKKSLSTGSEGLLNKFLGIVRVKLFNIHHRHSPAQVHDNFDFEESASHSSDNKGTVMCCC